VPLAIGDISW